ncbi:MAG TPA: zinc metallopeptidase [Candidatus Dojkabacteria bacterium]|jgi:Zn-dependent membrane protease YugP|nr:zinc metallopeptidase [Candidatus Dojkabacteria bacterium]
MDSTYLLFSLPALILTIAAQIYVKTTFNKYSKIPSGEEKTGLDAAQDIIKGEGFSVTVVPNQNPLGDYFDPIKNIVAISSDNVNSNSVSNVSVVAHEMGHVQQKYSSSLVYHLRRIFIPVSNIGTQIGYVLFFVGLMLSKYDLSTLGLLFFSSSIVISLITIPVELNASKRGLKFLQEYNLISKENIPGAKKVLKAAALTYFAALVTSIVNVMYYASILGGRRSRD